MEFTPRVFPEILFPVFTVIVAALWKGQSVVRVSASCVTVRFAVIALRPRQ